MQYPWGWSHRSLQSLDAKYLRNNPPSTRQEAQYHTHCFVLLTKHRHGHCGHQNEALIISKLGGERKGSYWVCCGHLCAEATC